MSEPATISIQLCPPQPSLQPSRYNPSTYERINLTIYRSLPTYISISSSFLSIEQHICLIQLQLQRGLNQKAGQTAKAGQQRIACSGRFAVHREFDYVGVTPGRGLGKLFEVPGAVRKSDELLQRNVSIFL